MFLTDKDAELAKMKLQPSQWAWEGLRRNRGYIERSNLISKSLPGHKPSGRDLLNVKNLIISDELWGEDQISEFGLRYWIPVESPRTYISFIHWDDRFLSENLIPRAHVSVNGKVSQILDLCTDKKDNLWGMPKEETAKISIIPGHIDDKHQQVIVLDNRRAKEYQLAAIANILEIFDCVPKKEGQKPEYDLIDRALKVYDRLEQGQSDLDTIMEFWPEECRSEDQNIPAKIPVPSFQDLKDKSEEERKRIISKIKDHNEKVDRELGRISDQGLGKNEAGLKKLVYHRDYAAVFAGNKPQTAKLKTHYMDLLMGIVKGRTVAGVIYQGVQLNTAGHDVMAEQDRKKAKPKGDDDNDPQ